MVLDEAAGYFDSVFQSPPEADGRHRCYARLKSNKQLDAATQLLSIYRDHYEFDGSEYTLATNLTIDRRTLSELRLDVFDGRYTRSLFAREEATNILKQFPFVVGTDHELLGSRREKVTTAANCVHGTCLVTMNN